MNDANCGYPAAMFKFALDNETLPPWGAWPDVDGPVDETAQTTPFKVGDLVRCISPIPGVLDHDDICLVADTRPGLFGQMLRFANQGKFWCADRFVLEQSAGRKRHTVEPRPSSPSGQAGPYAIGSRTWPGIGKAVEEMGELLQVLGKIIGAGGKVDHWDGKRPLNERAEEEIADVSAALQFLMYENKLDYTAIHKREDVKFHKFRGWHRNPEPTP